MWEEAVDEFDEVKVLKVSHLFAHADEAHRDVELVGDGQDGAAFCGAIEFRDNQAGNAQRIVKRLGSLPRGTFDQLLPLFAALFTDS